MPRADVRTRGGGRASIRRGPETEAGRQDGLREACEQPAVELSPVSFVATRFCIGCVAVRGHPGQYLRGWLGVEPGTQAFCSDRQSGGNA